MARSKTPETKVKVKTLHVEVTQDKMMKTIARVPQWEAHILLALWGDDANIVGENYEDRAVPTSVEDEFQRLADKYGPKDSDVPLVAQVFGSFGPGLRSLANEIDISTAGGTGASQPEPSISERAGAADIQLPFDPDANPDDEDEDDDVPLTDEQIAALDSTPSVSVTGEDGKVVVVEPTAKPTTEAFADLT